VCPLSWVKPGAQQGGLRAEAAGRAPGKARLIQPSPELVSLSLRLCDTTTWEQKAYTRPSAVENSYPPLTDPGSVQGRWMGPALGHVQNMLELSVLMAWTGCQAWGRLQNLRFCDPFCRLSPGWGPVFSSQPLSFFPP
jgi:hypothetical protein